ncbi:MAG: succinate dehydrogenase, cytochrome b556 subunit [Gammaproteobacteria bacterium]
MSEIVKDGPRRARPEFRNIHVTQIVKYRLPPPGIVSILHRISGAALFLCLPFLLYLFQESLLSEDTFLHFAGVLSYPLVKIILLGLIWAYFQHFCAGLRHLFMDVHWALEKDSARSTALAVIAISLLLTLVTGLKLFGVF